MSTVRNAAIAFADFIAAKGREASKERAISGKPPEMTEGEFETLLAKANELFVFPDPDEPDERRGEVFAAIILAGMAQITQNAPEAVVENFSKWHSIAPSGTDDSPANDYLILGTAAYVPITLDFVGATVRTQPLG